MKPIFGRYVPIFSTGIKPLKGKRLHSVKQLKYQIAPGFGLAITKEIVTGRPVTYDKNIVYFWGLVPSSFDCMTGQRVED
jgi:hypothetical protein